VRRKGIFQAWAHFQEVREFLSGSSRKKDHSTLTAKVTVEKSESSHLISMSCHNWLWSRKYLVFWKYCSTKNWFLRWHSEKSIYQCRRCRFDPWVGKIPWRRKWLPAPECLGNPMDVGAQQVWSMGSQKELDPTQWLKTTKTKSYLFQFLPSNCKFLLAATLNPKYFC
jgi:hypothetical protein